MKTVAADGNFQLSRYMRTNDRAKDIAFDGQDEVDRYWVKPDNIISYNERVCIFFYCILLFVVDIYKKYLLDIFRLKKAVPTSKP